MRYDLLTTIADPLTQDDAPLAQALMGLGIPSLNELLLGALMNNLEIIDTL